MSFPSRRHRLARATEAVSSCPSSTVASASSSSAAAFTYSSAAAAGYSCSITASGYSYSAGVPTSRRCTKDFKISETKIEEGTIEAGLLKRKEKVIPCGDAFYVGHPPLEIPAEGLAVWTRAQLGAALARERPSQGLVT